MTDFPRLVESGPVVVMGESFYCAMKAEAVRGLAEIARLREALEAVLPYAAQQDCGGPDIAAALSKARAALAGVANG